LEKEIALAKCERWGLVSWLLLDIYYQLNMNYDLLVKALRLSTQQLTTTYDSGSGITKME
jgi:hypothetical protein